MQFAACTKRTFLTVSSPGFFPLAIAVQTSHSTAAVAAKQETVPLTEPNMPPHQEIRRGNR
jgi:hypothetical protein